MVVVVVVLSTVLGVVAVRADPNPALPPVEPDGLLASTLRALSEPFSISGEVTTILDLGLPELPVEGQLGAGPVNGPLATLLGRQSFKVWRSPDGVRMAHLLDVGEQDLVANGDDAWYWDSASMTAWRLPTNGLHPGGTEPPMPTDRDVPSFARATRDRFFLCVEATDPRFDREGTRRFLEGLHPREVNEVEP